MVFITEANSLFSNFPSCHESCSNLYNDTILHLADKLKVLELRFFLHLNISDSLREKGPRALEAAILDESVNVGQEIGF